MGTKEIWREYVAFLKKHVPASYANLAPGATDETLAKLEKKLGVTLPESLKTVWRMNDGQKKTMTSDSAAATPCLPSLSFLSTKEAARIWTSWGKVRSSVDEEELENLHSMTSSAIPGVVKALYSSPKWIPLWADPSRPDYIGLDLDPDEDGVAGQIINFGRNEDEHFQIAETFDELLAVLLDEVKSGRWKADVLEGEKKDLPWFGDPDKNFFNVLYAHAKERPRKAPAKKKATANKKATAKAPPPLPARKGPPKLGTHVVPPALAKALEPLTTALLRQLESGAGKHRRASCHVEIERRAGSLEVASTSGGLQSDDDVMLQKGASFVSGDAYERVLDRVITKTNTVAPLYMLDYRFEKKGSGWTHRSTAQTIEGHTALERARKSLDEHLRALVAGHLRDDTDWCTFKRELDEPPAVILVAKDRSVVRPPLTAADEALLAAYDDFHREHGFALVSLMGRVHAKNPKRIELKLSYGLPAPGG